MERRAVRVVFPMARGIAALLLAGVCLAVAAGSARAIEVETCICRSGIVSRGNLMAEVLKKCGPPTFAVQREEKKIEKRGFSIVTVDEWTYNFGPQEFMYDILFENGRVARIESLDYGY